MRANVILRFIGIVVLLNAAFMLLSALVALIYGFDSGYYPLLLSSVMTAALGSFPLIFVKRSNTMNMKEGYAIVVGAWLVACFTGMFPYLLWGGQFDPATAWFESVSGFTTTGATALSNIETLPNSLLFWRSCTHWLGGVGVVMFVLVIMPKLGRTKLTLSSVELSPLARENYRYSSARIIRILLSLYLGMTIVQTISLYLAGMNWFDAVNHSFSTIATGGFSTHDTSIGYYDSLAVEMIVLLFMTLSGIHFGLIFATLAGKRNNIFRSEVTKFYFGTLAVAILFVSLNLWTGGIYDSYATSLRHSAFQCASFITTTGFITADVNLWSPFSIIVLTWLMIQCACAGSTSGGIKTDRIWLAIKSFRTTILRQQHPNAVLPVKINGIVQDGQTVGLAMLFIVIYLLLVVSGSLVFTACGLDMATGISMAVSCMGNIGPGFGDIGPMNDYSLISPFIKTFSTLLMLLGRLEIFGLIQLFLLKWWR